MQRQRTASLRRSPQVGADVGCCETAMCAFQSPRLLLAPLLQHRPCFAAQSRMVSAAAARQQRPKLSELEDLQERTQACYDFRRFIADRDLARNVVSCLNPAELRRSGVRVFECNPGPGILTHTLLDAGVQVAALERDKLFLPELQSLKHKAGGKLDVLHCDFFQLNPFGQVYVKPPSMYSEVLFRTLGITEVPWTADVPVKVIGIFPDKKEGSKLWKLIYELYERTSIFEYGRIEMNMFISEKEYVRLIAGPGEKGSYQAISVLYQAACDMELLLKEPWSSFLTSAKAGKLCIPKSVRRPNDHLCLVRITPRRDLFSHNLTTANSATFAIMMKQCFGKPKAKLIKSLESWVPGSGLTLLKQLMLPEDIVTSHVSAKHYKQLFEIMEHSGQLNTSWIIHEHLESDIDVL